MLDKLSKLTPPLSVLALLLVSTFNIGYFSRVGIHFLGLIDLSNIAYSVGITFVGLLFLLNFLLLAVMHGERTLSNEKAPAAYKRFFEFGAMPLALVWSIYIIALVSEIVPQRWRLSSDLAFLLMTAGVLLLTIVRGIIAYYEKRRTVPPERAFAFISALIITTFFVGRVEAARAVFQSEYLYRITDKNGSVFAVRIVRSSSAGFLVAKDGKVMFLPTGEIRSIESDYDLRSEKLK